MNIICLIKFVPDVDSIDLYADHSSQEVRTARMILNPDDACAVAFALKMKQINSVCSIEVVSLGPLSVRPHMEDLIRLKIDKATLISDPIFEDSDSSATSEILSRYIKTRSFDCLLTGSISLDSGNACVPVQLAELLDLDQMLDIGRIDPEQFDHRRAVFDVADEDSVTTYEMKMPGVLSLSRESRYKLPYMSLTEMQRDVSDELNIITNQRLGFSKTEVGQSGALTNVIQRLANCHKTKKGSVVQTDDEGVTHVFNFLKEKGYL